MRANIYVLMRNVRTYLFLAIVALAGISPLITPAYISSFLLITYMFIALAGSWNILAGYTGYVCFGHQVFVGVGAYTTAVLISRYGLEWVPSSIIGGILAVTLALVLGIPTLRLKGHYFAIATIGINEVFKVIAYSWTEVTRGGWGLPLPSKYELFPCYYAMGIIALTASLLSYAIKNSKFGLRLIAIREDEVAAEVIGVNTARNKLIAFLVSAFFPGVAGGVYAWYLTYIDPETAFSPWLQSQMVVMTLLGGAGTVYGPILGAVVFSVVWEMLWAQFPMIHLSLLGTAVVCIVLFMPEGITGYFKRRGVVRFLKERGILR